MNKYFRQSLYRIRKNLKSIPLLYISLYILFFTTSAFASPFIPLIRYFSIKDYQAGNQNWSVTQGNNGIMYFGNTNGLLSYDGYHWELTKVPGGQNVRSVFSDGKRIYIGSFEEFGYFDITEYGELQYHSLSKLLKNFKLENDEIWKIIKIGKTICFQSFGSLFFYNGKNVTGYRNRKHIPFSLFSYDGKMYIQLIDEGLSTFDGRSYHEIIHRSQLNNSDVVSICPYRDRQMLLVTKSGKIFVYSQSGKLMPFSTKIDDALKRANVNRAVITKDGMLILGTISDGIYAIRMNGNLLWHFNRRELLNNNTVLGLCCDANNNIWVSLDDGIAYIKYNSPLTLFSPNHNEQPIGMIYSILHRDDAFYLATNQGVYKMNTKNNALKMIPNSAEQNWYIDEFDGQIFSGGNISCMEIKNDVATHIKNTAGSTCIQKCAINGKEILLNSTYSNLEVFIKGTSGRWTFSHNIKGFSNPIRHFDIDQDGSIWLSHMYKGAYHLWLTDDLKSVRYIKFIPNLEKNSDEEHIRVMKIQGNIVLADDKELFIYSNIKHQLTPFYQLNKILPQPCSVLGAVEINSHLFWLITSIGYILLDGHEGTFHIQGHIPFSNFDSTIHTESSVFVDYAGNSYFNLNNSFAYYNPSYRNMSDGHIFKIGIAQIQCYNKKKESVLLPLDKIGQIKPSYREISFRLLIPHYDQTPYRIHYCLEGGGLNLASNSYEPVIHYSNLEYGSYNFSAIIYNDLNQKIGEVNYSFVIHHPFYLSWAAILLYIILVTAVGYYIIKWRLYYLMKKEKEAYENKQAQQKIKMHEQELLIAEQKRKLLESEVSSKSKELASMTMGIIAKNSMLEELRSTIQEQMKKGATTNKFMHQLLNQINENTENKEFWEVFQQNFDLIHANFFRHLRERYPDLTPTDLRFCALLRLNLTTKDIAQINNLTVRGVEAARYRIRKKLNIPEEISLVDFLIDLK